MDEIDLTSLMVDKKEESIQKPIQMEPIVNNNNLLPSNIHNSVNDIINKQIVQLNKSPKIKKEKENKTEASIDRRRIILILQFYINEFPEKLNSYKGTNFEKLSNEKLNSLKNEFDFIIGAKCNIKSTQYAFIQGVSMLELVCKNFTPLKVDGLTNIVNDSEFQDDVKHLALKYMTIIKTEPEHRVAYKILSNMMLLHQFNSSNIGNINQNNLEEINKINNKYSEL